MTTKELNNAEIKEKLEKLLLSEDLEKLTNSTSYFNIFNALSLQNVEIRHSNFLGWFMSPYETHGIGVYFLREFLKSAIKNYSSKNEQTNYSLIDIANLNLSDAEIVRESEKNIDILIKSEKDKFVCVIENKIWTDVHDSNLDSGEKGSQLLKYAQYVKENYSDYKPLFIYLAPNVEANADLIEVKDKDDSNFYYIPMNYEQVLNVIEKVLNFKSELMQDEVKIFIRHYAKMLERNIMGKISDENLRLCKQIYREHKEAINLINEQMGNIYKDRRKVIIDEVIKNLCLIKRDISIPTYTRCISSSLDIPELKFADKYSGKDENQVLMFEFVIQNDSSLSFDVVIGQVKPNDNDKKKKLCECINNELSGKLIKYDTVQPRIPMPLYEDNLKEIIINTSDYDIISDITKKIKDSDIIPKIEQAVKNFKAAIIEK